MDCATWGRETTKPIGQLAKDAIDAIVAFKELIGHEDAFDHLKHLLKRNECWQHIIMCLSNEETWMIDSFLSRVRDGAGIPTFG